MIVIMFNVFILPTANTAAEKLAVYADFNLVSSNSVSLIKEKYE